MAQPNGMNWFPEWLKKAIDLGYSQMELAKLLGTTPATVAQLIRAVPTRPAEVRKLARELGVDYKSLRTFTDNALQPLTGFDKDTQRLLRLWERLDPPRREAVMTILQDMARGRPSRRPAATKTAGRRKPR